KGREQRYFGKKPHRKAVLFASATTMLFDNEEVIPFDPSESSTFSEHIPLREPHISAIPNSYIGDIIQPPIPTETATFASPLPESLRWKEREKDCRVKNLGTYLRRNCSKTQLSVMTVVLLCFVAFPTTIALLLFSKNQRQQSNDLSGSRLILSKFTLTRPLMSFDYEKYFIILSQENRPHEVLIERLPLNDTEAGFKSSVVPVPKGMRKCRQLSDDVLCCFAEQLSKIGTHCFSQEENTTRHLYERWMAPSNFWQTLQVDGTMVGVRRNRDYRILNTRTGRVYAVSYDEKPMDLTPASYFFPMENIFELEELAINGNKFFVCEYVKLSTQHFRLVGDKDEKCRQTSFVMHEGMRGIRFCANPIYHAIVEFDAVRPRGHCHMRWQLQVSYKDDDDSVFKFDANDISPSGQIAIE
uniref:Uncharacterized protein n=1 Tax=Parascaris univalens TaxID=6257 RepID=A0A915BRE2_PARUN